MFGGTHQWMKNIVCFDILFFKAHLQCQTHLRIYGVCVFCLLFKEGHFIFTTCDTQASNTCVSGEAAGKSRFGMEVRGEEKVVQRNPNPGKEAAEILRAFPLLDFCFVLLFSRMLCFR